MPKYNFVEDETKPEDLKEGEIRPFTEKEIEDLKKSLKL